MKTSDFEVKFIKALTRHIESKHAGLEILTEYQGAASLVPDVVVRNNQSGRVLFIEVKGGTSSNTVPFASLSKLLQLRARHEGRGSVLLISSAEIPSSMRSMLKDEKIGVAQVHDVQDAIQKIDPELNLLEGR